MYTSYCQYCYKATATKAIESTNHIISNPTSVVKATCSNPGVVSGKCDTCKQDVKLYIDALDHNWQGGSCTISPVCATCGEVGEPSGHKLNIFGKCKTCGDNPSKNKANETISNLKDYVNSLINKATGAGDELKSDINTMFSKIMMVINGIIVIIVLIYVVPVLVKLYKKIFAKKEKCTRRKK